MSGNPVKTAEIFEEEGMMFGLFALAYKALDLLPAGLQAAA